MKVKHLILGAFVCTVLLTATIKATAAISAAEKEIYYFYGQGCPHCAKVEEYFAANEIEKKYPLKMFEVYFDRENAQKLNELFDKYAVPLVKRGVPAVFLDDAYLIGDDEIIKHFTKIVEKNEKLNYSVDTNEFKLTLLLVVGGALVDAINPCAFAVLIILLASMAIVKKDKTALKGGLAFSLAVFISYFLMGLGVYKALSYAGLPLIFLKVVGFLAIILGFWNLKDFLAYKKYLPPLEVPFSWRPKMSSFIRKVTTPSGAFLVGILVSLFLLPCTSGPYLLILSMLSQKETWLRALIYLTLYNIIFVSPMVVITLLVYRGLEPEKAEEVRKRNIKRLHLIAGIILILMGGYLINY